MRPRINNTFGKIFYRDLNQYLTDNHVYGFTVKVDSNILIYSFHIMFRDTRKNPEVLYVKVSRTSKLVIGAYTNRGIQFNSVDELKKYTKK